MLDEFIIQFFGLCSVFKEQPRVMNSEADPFEILDSESIVKYLKSL